MSMTPSVAWPASRQTRSSAHRCNRSSTRRIVRLLEGLGLRLVQHPEANHKIEVRFSAGSQDIVVARITASVMQDEMGVPLPLPVGGRRCDGAQDARAGLISHANTASKLLASFTSRETEVLELLEATSSASQIADRLVLSVRTVETHLANVYRKLGCPQQGGGQGRVRGD